MWQDGSVYTWGKGGGYKLGDAQSDANKMFPSTVSHPK